ncbi:MAG: hypothetical protein M1819_002736 [Sarea resinae]|nr:MAG: hypothetical protein M1819_002736 [Sarea resinae]
MAPIPITILTGFLGSGKTTLILNLLPQLPPDYKLALLKNEFGDLAVDSQLASSSAISGVQELLNGCICCNLVGQLSDALETLLTSVHPDRIIIETSGSAFPATLAMEVNRLSRETGLYVLDGVVAVIDVENWKGYEDTSYTAKLQARYTDLIVFNKWEGVDERKYEDAVDRVGDMGIETAYVKSDKGRVGKDVILGVDRALAKELVQEFHSEDHGAHDEHAHDHHEHEDHAHDHQSEVEVLSLTLPSPNETSVIDLEALESFLLAAPKDEVYRIKAIMRSSRPPNASNGEPAVPAPPTTPLHDQEKASEEPAAAAAAVAGKYILNWAFGRWTFSPLVPAPAISTPPSQPQAQAQPPSPSPPQQPATTTTSTTLVPLPTPPLSSGAPSPSAPAPTPASGADADADPALRMTIILARGEAAKWQKRLEAADGAVRLAGADKGALRVKRIT